MEYVVISGGNGFLGKKLTKRFIEAGYGVYLLTTSRLKRKDPDENVISIDINLPLEEIKTKIPKVPTVFIHLAWIGVSPESRSDFNLQLRNIDLSMKLIELAHLLKIKKFVFPGSLSENLTVPGGEKGKAFPDPCDAYGAVKSAVRALLLGFCKLKGIDFISVILSSIYSSDRKDNNVIFYVIDKLLSSEKPSLTTLEQKWNFIYDTDAVEGLFLVSTKGVGGKIYELGGTENFPLKKYVYTVRDLIDPNAKLGLGEITLGSKQIDGTISLKEINKDTGFTPKTSFKQGIISVLANLRRENG